MPHDNLITDMARAMCSADGVDPDREVSLKASEQFQCVRGEDVLLSGAYGPAWKQYTRLARLHLAARDVLLPEAGRGLPSAGCNNRDGQNGGIAQ